MRTSIKYTISVWLFTGIVSPFIYLLFCLPRFNENFKDSPVGLDDFINLGIILGLLFSIPSAIILLGVILILSKKHFANIKVQLILSILSLILSMCSFAILFGKDSFLREKVPLRFLLSYGVTVVSACFIFMPKSLKEN
jgi:hypothetical protein